MAVMLLRTFRHPVPMNLRCQTYCSRQKKSRDARVGNEITIHFRTPPSVGRRFFETSRHDNRIKLIRDPRNRHDRGAGSRPANACRSSGGISQYYLDVAGSDYWRYGRNTRLKRCSDWIRGRFNYRSSLELRPIMVAGGRLD
jgi:hypothetical protein